MDKKKLIKKIGMQDATYNKKGCKLCLIILQHEVCKM